ncbi:LEPR-XLL domain-containing protein [Thioclava pacifica]|uniref:Uncharacterized protein n=1 Tax=Thioclava pacifica DSM 10166 TaxID=1353537 RepID=A0A074J0N1_9RHOB|nr:LEPR-XLL domain-containing protein [Thioclava pacifica]KEO50941.1 hypothetical protein TP2_13715 [Thioclava pacifica DSM 10166]
MGVNFGPHSTFRGHRPSRGKALGRARNALRNCTALTPSENDRRKRGALAFDSLEKRYLLSADISPYADALDDGLDRLELLIHDLESFEELAADIPVLDESLAEASALADTLQTELLDPLRAMIDSATGTFDDLNDDLNTIAGLASTLFEDGNEARFDIQFDTSVLSGGNSFDFGAAATQFGLAIDADFDFSVTLDFDFGFGVLLDTSLAPGDAAYIASGAELTLAGMADLEAAASGDVIKIGMLGDASLDATSDFDLKASVTAVLNENSPVNDGRITISELDGAGIALLSTAINNADTGLTASLKLDSAGAISGLTLDDAGVTITLDGNFFEDPSISISIDAPDLLDFTRVNASTLLSFIGDLGGKLESLAGAFDALAQIDFININVSDFSSFNAALRQVIDSLSVPGLLGGALTDLAELTSGGYSFDIKYVELAPTDETPTISTETINLDFDAISAAVDLASDKLEELVDQINTAIGGAVPIEAFVRDGFIGLRATSDYVTDIVLENVAAEITALLGFQNDLTALPLPTFSTIQEFATKLADLDIFDGTGANLTYDAATNSLKFDLDIGFDSAVFDRTLSFNKALDLGLLGELALAGSATVHVDAGMGFALGAGIDLSELTETFELAALNGGLGIRTNGTADPDLLFETRDGWTGSVDLDVVMTTIADLRTHIETETGGRVTLDPDIFGSGLVLTDTSVPNGADPVFSVAGGTGSKAVFDMGFGFGLVAASGSDTISGGLIVDRFFIDANSMASAEIGMSMENVNLYGALGFITVGVVDGGTTTPIGFKLDMQLNDVESADGLDRLYLTELGVTDGDGFAALDTVAFDGGITGELILPVVFEDGGAFGLDDANFDLTINFEVGSILPVVDTSGIENLVTALSNLGSADLLTLVRELSSVLFDKMDLLNADLPLIDGSIGDLVTLLQDAVDDVIGPVTDRINTLLAIEADRLLALLNPQDIDGVKQAAIDSGFFAGDLDALDAFNDFTALSTEAANQLLSSDVGELLLAALEELRAQVIDFGTSFDFFFSDTPSKLIAAFAAVRGAIANVREEFAGDTDFLDEFEATFGMALDSIEDAIPSTHTILKLVQNALGFELPDLDDTLEDIGAKLTDTLKQALVDASAASDTVGDLATMTIAELIGLASELLDDMGDAAQTEVDALQAKIAELIADVGSTIADLPGVQADQDMVQAVLDALDDLETFLTDESLEGSLAWIVDQLSTIAAEGEDIFELMALLPSLTDMIEAAIEKVETLAGDLLVDLADYLAAYAGDFTAGLTDEVNDVVDALTAQANALVDRVVEEFRASVLGLFGGGLIQFDYSDGMIKADLRIAPSVFDVDVSGVDFDFSFGSSLFNAGIEDSAFSFQLGGMFELGLALEIGDLNAEVFESNFNLLVSEESGFRLDAALAVDGVLVINAGGVGIRFENPTDPVLQLTNFDGTGPAYIDIGVSGAATDGYIALGDLGFSFDGQARLVADALGFYKNGTAIMYDSDNADADDGILTGTDAQVDFGFDVQIGMDTGEFVFDAAINPLTALELEAIAAGLLDFSNLLEAFELILDFLVDATDALAEAPLIGGPVDALNDALEGFRSLYESMKAELEALEEGAGDLVEQAQHILFDALEPILNAEAMKGNAGDLDAFTFEDILLSFDISDRELILEPLFFGFDITDTVPFDFGMDAFVIEVESEGGVTVNFLLNVAMGFGLSADRGAFLVLPDVNEDDVIDPILTGEFSVGLTPDSELNFRLFFLGVNATPWDDDPDNVATDVGLGRGVGLATELDVGLVDGGGVAVTTAGLDATDKGYKIDVADLGGYGLDVDFAIAVNIDLHLQGGADFGGGLSIADLPNVTTDLNIDWMWSAGDGALEAPGVQFYDLSLNMGEFVENALGPLIDFIDDFTAPLDPFLKFLGEPVPILSQLSELFGQGEVTVRDAIGLLGSGIDSVDTLIEVLDTIAAIKGFIDNLSEGTLISFGDFIISDPYAVAPGAVSAMTTGIDLTSASGRTQLNGLMLGEATDIGVSPGALQTAIDNDTDGSDQGGGLSGIFDQLHDVGLFFPFIEEPAQLFGLLFGQRVDFVVWDIPRLSAEFGISYKFGPILPPVPLFVTLGGGFEIFLDLSVGYDSRGLETGDFLDGFYFGDHAFDPVSKTFTDEDILELGLKVFFEATASLSVLVAEAGVTGGVEAQIGANWADDDGDGKFYLDEIGKKLNQGIFCIFDFEGALTAYLEAFVKLGFDTPFGFVTLFEDTFELLRVTLLDFSFSCPPLPPPELATVDGPDDTTARLNIGTFAEYRRSGADGNDDEKLEIFGDRVAAEGQDEISLWAYDGALQDAIDAGYFSDGKITHSEAVAALSAGYLNHNLDLNMDDDIDTDEIRAALDLDNATGSGGADRFALIIGFGEWEVFNNITVLYGDAAGGDDEILGDAASLKVALHVLGGAGEDELLGGMGNDILLGGADVDVVRGFGGNDSLAGDGAASADATNGLSVSNYVASAGTDGADNVFGGDGGDAIYGGGANDTLKGDGEDDSDSSGDGADWIYGNDGEDAITGHLGNDVIFGGRGADNIDAGAGDDVIRGDYDVAFGSALSTVKTASPNATIGETDLILGGLGADFIRGDGANDIIFGEEDGFELGELAFSGLGDTIYGDGGDDVIRGQFGNDQIFGGDDEDLLIGGAGADTIHGDDDADEIWGDRYPADSLPAAGESEQSSANDRIEGGDGADLIHGQEGDDLIIGGVSDTGEYGVGDADTGDVIYGEAGHDIILGDDGTITDATHYATNTTGTGGNDRIYAGNGDDQVAGGRGSDTLYGDPSGGTGEDILFGDEILRDGLSIIGTHNAALTDGADLILGFGGSDLIVGGGASDTGFGSAGDDLIVGDYAELLLKASGSTLFDRIAWVISLDPGMGAADRLFGETGQDIVIGGDGGDTVSGGSASDTNEDDILLGDHGLVVRDDGSAFANDIFSIFGNTGGADLIYGSGGADIIIGGTDDDTISGGSADDVIFGDAGLVLRDGDTPPDVTRVISTFAGIDVEGIPAAPAAFAGVELGLDAGDALASGDDDIDGGSGSDVALGGLGSDLLYGRTGDDVLLGDNGEVLYTGEGSGLAAIITVRTRGTNGGIDAILGEAGRDLALGGAEGDFIFGDLTATLPRLGGSFDLDVTFSAVGGAGEDALGGDFGTITVQDGAPVYMASTDPSEGGRDLIEGNEGDDIVIGGADSDALHGDAASVRIALIGANTGDDIVIGDSGLVNWLDGDVDPATVDLISTTAPGEGASDVIFGNNGEDILIGGAAGDRIYGDRSGDVDLSDLSVSNQLLFAGNGYDRILGDNGFVDFVITSDTVAGRADLGSDPILLAPGTILISSSDPTEGGDDLILGDGMSDLIFGGTGSDRIWGDYGGDFASDAYMGDDVILGDHGKAWQTVGAEGRTAPWVGDDYFAIFTGASDGGAGDVIFGEAGNDIAMGQQGDDVIFGGLGNDDLIGGHNTAGGSDDLDGLNPVQVAAILPTDLSDLDPTDLQEVNDILSGGEGQDVIAGDNAIIQREGISASDRFRELAGDTLYSMITDEVVTPVGTFEVDLGFTPNIGAAVQDPNALLPRNVFLLDFDASIEQAAANDPSAARPFGDDVIAGGAEDDVIYGQLGDDIVQGDGEIELVAADTVDPFTPGLGGDPSFVIMSGGSNVTIADAPVLPVTPANLKALRFSVGSSAADGDDYIEGNGGNDRIYGNLGQDDLIGGSSELAAKALFSSLTGEGLRPDGADLIYGGAGDAEWLARNADYADTSETIVDETNAHTADADLIVGDNANVFRLVGEAFTYAAGAGYGDGLTIRVAEMLDYAYSIDGSATNPDTGTVDWKTSFNDFGVGAGDLIYGESGDDVIFGMTGDDLIYGNAGDDDLYGQAGADVLLGGRGTDGLVGDDGLIATSRNGLTEGLIGLTTPNMQEIIRTPGNLQIEMIYPTGDLLKSMTAIAFDLDGVSFAIDGAVDPEMTSANDIIFGGWEDDFIHGGYGDDAVSGAEALPEYYAGGADVNAFLQAQQDTGMGAPAAAPAPFWFGFGLYNPGDILRFGAYDPEEFALYDEDDPRSRIMVTETVDGFEVTRDFLLNNDAADGVEDQTFTMELMTDGADKLFGDLGNDWIVGGTGRDHMFGGRGNDLLQMDDDLDTDGGDNRRPDSYQEYADIVYSGAGRDYIILNTGADRAIDWIGEYNSYIVPFSPFGAFQIARLLQPHTEQFVLDLARAAGADESTPDILRFAEQIAIDDKLDNPLDPDVYDERHGSPFNELGMVRQEDFDWGDQSGPPDDPQAGNDHGPRNIMRRELWEDTSGMSLSAQAKLADDDWYLVEQAFADAYGDADTIEVVGKLKLKADLQMLGELGGGDEVEYGSVEFTAKTDLEKFNKKSEANTYLLFDATDDGLMKYAGIDVASGKLVIGIVENGNWIELASLAYAMRSGTDYVLNLLLEESGLARLSVDGMKLSYTFDESVTDGGYGLASTGVQATIKDTKIVGSPIIEQGDEVTESFEATALATVEPVSAPLAEEDSTAIDWGDATLTDGSTGTSDTGDGTVSLESQMVTSDSGTTDPTTDGGTSSSDPATTDEELVVVEAWMPRDDFAA